MRRPWPELLLSLATVCAFAGALVGVELVLRALQPDYLYELHADESSNVYSETYGWELRKGFRGMDFGHVATVSRKGTRGPEHAYEKPPGRTRVVMLGDSITYAAGVADDETFSSVLEARGPRFDVVNLGVGGYGTDQELIQLEREALRYHPDVVVLNFCIFSDFADNALPTALFDARQPKPYFTWDGRTLVKHDQHLKLGALRKAEQWLSDYSFAFNRVRGAAGLARPPRQPGVWMDRLDTVMTDLPEAAELTFQIVRRMADVSRQAGASFFVIVHPSRFVYSHRSRLLRKFCEAPALHGVPVIDMGERFRERGLGFDAFAFDAPGHLNVLGNRLAAESIDALLSQPSPAGWDYRQYCRSDPAH